LTISFGCRIPRKNSEEIIFFFTVLKKEERQFLRQKKSTTFFHARISRSGKGRVSDFSATRVRVESVGPPRPQVEFEKWKKVLLYFCTFGEDGIFFAKLAFSAVICGI
jgi:hypothetical protein